MITYRKTKFHRLKTWPEYFHYIYNNRKKFEVRRDDRDFEVGDILILEEFDPDKNEYTGRVISRQIDYILRGGKMGIESGFCVMSISKI